MADCRFFHGNGVWDEHEHEHFSPMPKTIRTKGKIDEAIHIMTELKHHGSSAEV